MALIVSTWLWGNKYSQAYIDRLQRGVRRHLRQPHEFVVMTPPNGDEALWPGCFCRLRMFSGEWQRLYGIKEGDRLVTLDLDMVITGPLDELFDRRESFLILQGANAANPCPYNGSVMMLRAGMHENVWEDFSLHAAKTIPFYEFPDDQGWIHHTTPNAAGWKVGAPSGIYGFRKPGWPIGDDRKLPAGARIVAFIGRRNPAQFRHLPWVDQHWR
jgi:hypothetical protein